MVQSLWRGSVCFLASLLLPAAVSLADEPRAVTDLDQDWRFIREDVPEATKPAFDDARWQAVSLPHTWNARDGADGSNYYRGPGWYRRHLDLRQHAGDLAHRVLVLRFGAASRVADVYVNGQKLGEHRGCFAAFDFDATSALKVGSDNVISVRVDNTTVPDVVPLSADFTFYGGLYRDVILISLPPVAISPFDDGSDGVYVSQSNVTAEHANLSIKVMLLNDTGASRDVTIKATVLDATEHAVTDASTKASLAGKSGDVTLKASIANPHLWQGRSDPYLYHVKVAIDGGDEVIVPLGLRAYAVSPATGFSLNGKPYPIRGVSRHQDRQDEGWAIGPKEQAEDFALIHEMGATAVRFAHYQQAPAAYEWCDRLGLVVWSEVPVVNRITPNNPALVDNAKQQLREMIKQNYNHPCVCFWSVFNELSNTLTKKEQQEQEPQQIALIKELNSLAHQLDTTRLTTAASVRPPENELNHITDVLAFNAYFGWYSPTIAKFAPYLDSHHTALPDRAIAMSEYGAGANPTQHGTPTTTPKTTGQWHPEEWQAIVHEQVYPMMAQRPWLWGSFAWIMFDFGSATRHEGSRPGINDKGLVSYDRLTKKDAFYFYKSQWSTEPFVYLTDRRFTPRAADHLPIKAYSNASEVELFVNDQSKGKMKPTQPGMFIWPDVTLSKGENRLKTAASFNETPVIDECTITIDPSVPTSEPAVKENHESVKAR